MKDIVAIDPGNEQSAFVWMRDNEILDKGLYENYHLLAWLSNTMPINCILLIEMVESYGMPVGKTVFETVLWVGRYLQKAKDRGAEVKLIPRKQVKLHHCNSVRAKDGNIIQVLKDKYGDKGTKKNPGYFYGFSADMWQAFALASYYYEYNNNIESINERNN